MLSSHFNRLLYSSREYHSTKIVQLERRVEELERKVVGRVKDTPYLRDGHTWNQFEFDYLSEIIDRIVNDLSVKFGRTPNAIWWSIYKYVKAKKE